MIAFSFLRSGTMISLFDFFVNDCDVYIRYFLSSYLWTHRRSKVATEEKPSLLLGFEPSAAGGLRSGD